MSSRNLEHIFNPKSVAVIGASSRKGSVGYALMKNLLGAEFGGAIYPVNHNRSSVLGVPCNRSVKDIGKEIDLAVIATPAEGVGSVVEECGEAGVKGIVIVSAGFAEMGDEGRKEEARIKEIAGSYGMRIVGPNCLGVINPRAKLNASFAVGNAKEGNIAFISQSGALCSSIIDWANMNNIGFSYFVSIGSMMDVDFAGLIDFFGEDPHTESIIIYMESIKNAKNFLSAARSFTITKPIIVLKSGKSIAGARAASSHTGAMAGEDAVYDAAFRRAGILRVDEIEDLFNCAKSLSMVPLPGGKRLAIVTNAGGPGVMATDAVDKLGCGLAKLSPEAMKELNEKMPLWWSKANPVDILGDAPPERYSEAMEIIARDNGVDGIIAIFTPQAASNADETASKIAEAARKYGKPILASFMGGKTIENAVGILEDAGIPNYFAPEKAVKAFAYLYRYKKNIEQLYETPTGSAPNIEPNWEKLDGIINDCLESKVKVMPEYKSKEFLKEYGIRVIKTSIAKNRKEALSKGREIGFPLALKVNSPDIVHKTDAGCVILGIRNEKSLFAAYDKAMKNAKEYNKKARIEGVTIQEYLENRDYEVIIGAKKDSIFGSVILFGMGGTSAEVMKDSAIGFPPLNANLAKRLMARTRIYRIMRKGYRNIKPVNSDILEELLVRFSCLVTDYPEIKEIDVNPVAINEKGAFALDARLVLDTTLKDGRRGSKTHLAIEPYPASLTKKAKAKDGRTLVLRVIRPEDESNWIELFNSLSDETKRFRFFHTIKEISRKMIIRYCHIDYNREIAIAAEVNDNGEKKLTGVGRIMVETGEFAVAVSDKYQNMGIGTILTKRIVEIAKLKNLEKIFCKMPPGNTKMIHLSERFGFKVTEENEKATTLCSQQSVDGKKAPCNGATTLSLDMKEAKGI